MSCLAVVPCPVEKPALPVYADVLSQAVTGELVGMANYASMVPLCTTVAEQMEAVEDAASERTHALAFRALARDLGVPIVENPRALYWRRIREAFLRQVAAGDLLACVVAQELMLESFAVPLYQAVAEASEGRMRKTFAAVARQEEDHLAHGMARLRRALEQDREGFEATVERVHGEVMTVLAEMVAPRDRAGPCGLCANGCVKERLGAIGLSPSQLRGRALRFYLRSLDAVGVRGERSLRWIANLPV